jgi:hypothetical protein
MRKPPIPALHSSVLQVSDHVSTSERIIRQAGTSLFYARSIEAYIGWIVLHQRLRPPIRWYYEGRPFPQREALIITTHPRCMEFV